MATIKVKRKPPPEDPERAEIGELREAWTAARRQLDEGAHPGACTVGGCRTMAFVTLRTASGRRPVCLRHFEMLRLEAA